MHSSTMHPRWLLFVLLLLLSGVETLRAQDSNLVIKGPFVARNLTVFLVCSDRPQIEHRYLRLDEALKEKKASLRETGTTNLSIVNTSGEDIFIQSGEIVKGGQQDRMIASDLVIPSGENHIPVAAFCVEHDRSSQRGIESLAEFSSASELVPLPTMQLAAKRQLLTHANTASSNDGGDGYTAPLQSQSRSQEGDPQALSAQLGLYLGQLPYQETAEEKAWQQCIWDGVTKVQDSLSQREGSSVKSKLSPSSLELTLELPTVQAAEDSVVGVISPTLKLDKSTIGIVCAVHGRIVSAELYGSSELLQQHLFEILRAGAVHALIADSSSAGVLDVSRVKAFLASIRSSPYERDVTNRVHLKSWEDSDHFLFESNDRIFPVNFLHRSYIAK